MSAVKATHYDTGGTPRCGNLTPFSLSTDQEAVTCGLCIALLTGTRGGWRWADVAPHGTLTAARRHYRHGEKPCDSCKQAMARRDRDRYNSARREAYAAARAAGLSARDALAARRTA